MDMETSRFEACTCVKLSRGPNKLRGPLGLGLRHRFSNLTSRACCDRDTPRSSPRYNGSQRHRQRRRRAAKLWRASYQCVYSACAPAMAQTVRSLGERGGREQREAVKMHMLTSYFDRGDTSRNVRRPPAPSLPRQLRPPTHPPQQMPA